MKKLISAGLGLVFPAFISMATAADLIEVRRLSLELARDVAWNAVEACREQGYQVTAVVVDRAANVQVVMRDVLAPRFTIQLAEKKANAVIMSGVSSAELRRNRADIRQELNLTGGLLLLAGGLPIRAAGSVVAAVGVSGAPGGDKDEACASNGVEAIQERLDFAD